MEYNSNNGISIMFREKERKQQGRKRISLENNRYLIRKTLILHKYNGYIGKNQLFFLKRKGELRTRKVSLNFLKKL